MVTSHNIDGVEIWSTSKKPRFLVVIIIGATGTGKSELAWEIATHFPYSEIINITATKFYDRLETVTNKFVPPKSCNSLPPVRYHCVGGFGHDTEVNDDIMFKLVLEKISQVVQRRNTPILVGSGNTLVDRLLKKSWLGCRDNYKCLVFELSVEKLLLASHVSRHVHKMVENGLVDEAREVFTIPEERFPRSGRVNVVFIDRFVVKKSVEENLCARGLIGVKELKPYFVNEGKVSEHEKMDLLGSCIQNVKDNACELIAKQLDEIEQLRCRLKKVRRVDASSVFKLTDEFREIAWQIVVVEPVTQKVKYYLDRNL